MPRHSYHEQDYAFGQVMLKLRTSLGLTQAGVANLLGVSRRAVGEWEGGLNYPKAERMQHFVALCVQQHVFAPGREEEEIRALGAFEETSAGRKDKTMEQQHESDLVKRLEQFGIKVDVSPTGATLTYEQIYTSGPTLEEALLTFLGEALSRYEALRKWKAPMKDG